MKDLVDIMGGDRSSGTSAQKSDLMDFDMVLHYDTGRAVLVSDTGEEKRAVWLPHSAIEVFKDGKTSCAVRKDGQRTVLPVVRITCPQWLAKEKGLI